MAGSSYYTMGSRKYPELATYFDNVEASMSSVAKVCDRESTIVQMVAFSEAEWQLPRYIEAMNKVGLSEFFLPELRGNHDGRLGAKCQTGVGILINAVIPPAARKSCSFSAKSINDSPIEKLRHAMKARLAADLHDLDERHYHDTNGDHAIVFRKLGS